MNSYYMINAELNGVEIYFEDKPDAEIREALKANRFRWNGRKKCWYAKQSEERIALAEKIASGEATAEQIRTEIQPAAAHKLTLEIMKEAAKQYTKERTGEGLYQGWTGCNAHNGLWGQDLKKAILNELKKNGIAATARTGRGGYTTRFDFTIKVPAEFIETYSEYGDRVEPIKEFQRFVVSIVDSFNSDHSNAMIDYFDCRFYDFYTYKAA